MVSEEVAVLQRTRGDAAVDLSHGRRQEVGVSELFNNKNKK